MIELLFAALLFAFQANAAQRSEQGFALVMWSCVVLAVGIRFTRWSFARLKKRRLHAVVTYVVGGLSLIALFRLVSDWILFNVKA